MHFDLFSEVLWNPWDRTAKALPDFGNEEYTKILCFGRADWTPNTLQVGEEWKASQEMFAFRSLVIAGNLEQVGREKDRWEEKDERLNKRWEEKYERQKKRWKEMDEREVAMTSVNETDSDMQKTEICTMGMIGVTGTLITGLLVLQPVHYLASLVVILGASVFFLNAVMLLLTSIWLDTIARWILWLIKLIFVTEGWEARYLKRGIIWIHRHVSIGLLRAYVRVVIGIYKDVERVLEANKTHGAYAH